MQTLKSRIVDRTFWLQTVLPCLLALAAAFIARYQLELSDGVTADYMAGQWPVYAPLNALTAFCLTLVLFAFLALPGRCSPFCPSPTTTPGSCTAPPSCPRTF